MAITENGVNSVHINQLLTNLSIGYHPSGFIADLVAPVVPVMHESGVYRKYNIGDAFRRVESHRPDGGRSNEVNFGFTLDNYLCESYALSYRLTDRMKENADSDLRLQQSGIQRLQDLILLEQEKRVADLFSTTSNYASTNTVTLSGTDQWNNASFAGSIESVIDTAAEAVRFQTGGNASINTAIIPTAVAKVIKRDSKIRDVIKYTQSNLLVNGDLPPTIWNLKILMPKAVENTARQIYNSDTFTPADIWGKNVILTYTPNSPSLDSLAHAYIFRARDSRVAQWREPERESDLYEVSYIQAEKIVSSVAGYLIAAVIA